MDKCHTNLATSGDLEWISNYPHLCENGVDIYYTYTGASDHKSFKPAASDKWYWRKYLLIIYSVRIRWHIKTGYSNINMAKD